MSLRDFIKKQFIDVIQWTEDGDGMLAWRYPMEGMEIQNGAALTVRESQLALFVDEGRIADQFGAGNHKLATNTLPVLTYLNNWDKLFESPFKSDVHFFSTRLQLDRKWGTPQPITIRDKDFGAVRLRAFGNYAFRVADPKKLFTEVSGTRGEYRVDDIDGQLRGMVLQNIADSIAKSGIPFLDLAANQVEFARVLSDQLGPAFSALGLSLEGFTVQSVSLPEELQKILDQKIGMGMIGNDMGKFLQYQTGQAIPEMAKNSGGGGGMAGDAMGLGAGLAVGQSMAATLQQSLANANQANQANAVNQPAQQAGAAGAAGAAGQAAPQGAGATPESGPAPSGGAGAMKPEEVTATLEKLHELQTKGILTLEEFNAKKAELLKKLF